MRVVSYQDLGAVVAGLVMVAVLVAVVLVLLNAGPHSMGTPPV